MRPMGRGVLVSAGVCFHGKAPPYRSKRMLRPPHLNLRLPKPKISLPRIRRLHLRFRRLEVGALWALVLLAALATLPSLTPDEGSSSTLSLGADPGGFSVQDEAAARYQAWLRGRAAAQDAACLLYTSPSPRDRQKSRMPSSA